MKKILIILLLLFSNLIFAQIVETDVNEDSHFKIYSSDVKFVNNYKNTRQFIKELELNLLSYIKDNELEKKVFDFYHNGNYRGIKYLSHYLQIKINSKALALTTKDKLKICNIIKKYDADSSDGDNCVGNVLYQNSRIAFWRYLPYYIKAYIKYIGNGKNSGIYFYSAVYFLIFFSFIILFIGFIRSGVLFIKDIYSLIFIKRPHYESLFWALSLGFLGLYIFSFKPLLLFLLIIALVFAYLDKKFIPLLIFLVSMPLLIEFMVSEFKIYEVSINDTDKLAFELIHTDMLPVNEQLTKLKDNKTFFSFIALANVYKKEKDYRLALKYYNDALNIRKTGFLYNNIANIYAIKGEYQKAISNYNEAKLYNDDTIYFYNLSKVYSRLKDKERALYYRKLASNLSKKLVSEFDEISTFNINRFFIDKFPDYKASLELYSKISKENKNNKYLNLFKVNHKKYLINLVIAAFFFLFLVLMFRRKLKAAYCQRCGAVFNNLDITERHKSFELCASCYSMMNTRSSLKKEDLMRKEKDIRIKKIIKKYRDIAINLLLPGSFMFYKLNSYQGVFFILWQSYYLVVVIAFYSKWKLIVNNNFFNFSTIVFAVIEISVYLYTYFKLIKRR